MSPLVAGVLCLGFAAIVGGATGFGFALIGTGIFAGVAMMVALPLDALRMFAGAATAVCGVWLALPMGRPGRPGTLLTATTGAVGGFLTSTTSLGGPPPVLLMQWARVPPLTFIADLAAYFVVTSALSLAVLLAGGRIPLDLPGWFLVSVLVAAIAGNAVGVAIARRLDRDRFRRVVIAFRHRGGPDHLAVLSRVGSVQRILGSRTAACGVTKVSNSSSRSETR